MTKIALPIKSQTGAEMSGKKVSRQTITVTSTRKFIVRSANTVSVSVESTIKVTHDDLMQKMADLGWTYEGLPGVWEMFTALLEVTRLHKPEGINAPQQCAYDLKLYPCPTIQAIDKELK